MRPMTVVGGLCRMVLGAPRCPHAAEVARASCSCPPEVTSSFSCCRPKCCADWHRFLSNTKVQAYMRHCSRSACISAAVADKPLVAFLQKAMADLLKHAPPSPYALPCRMWSFCVKACRHKCLKNCGALKLRSLRMGSVADP